MKKTDSEERLLRLARDIAEGRAVDWEAESEAQPDLSRRLEQLRLLQALGDAHRDGGVPEESRPDLPYVWGHLEVVEHLGRGGFGEVYRAHDPALKRDVALKVRRADRSWDDDSFLHEARSLAKVRHPNVLAVHGVARHDDRIGIWTDLVEGETLDARLARQGPMGPGEAALVGVELCRALAALHAAGLVHGDVKAANVMREERGRIVLMDLGVSTEAGAASPESGGTAVAASPEQLRGEALGPATDIHALGALLFHLTAGSHAYEGDSATAVLQGRMRGERAPLRDLRPDLPRAFVDIVERALATAPEARFPSVGAMESALAASLGSGPPPAAGGGSGLRPGRLLMMLGLIVGVAMVAWVAASWLRPEAVASLEAEASLFRAREGVEERLSPGSRIAPGDELFLEIETSQPAHVYVVDEDEAGAAFLMFPVPGFDLNNPLAPDTRHRLPGGRAGEEMNWRVTSAGGRELVLVVASAEPVESLERLVRDLPAVSAGRDVTYAAVSPEALDAFRGIGGVSAAPRATGPRSEPRLARVAEALAARGAGDPWARLFELQGER